MNVTRIETTLPSGYRLEAWHRPTGDDSPQFYCRVYSSKTGALLIGYGSEGDSILDALTNGAFNAGRHATLVKYRKTKKLPANHTTMQVEWPPMIDWPH